MDYTPLIEQFIKPQENDQYFKLKLQEPSDVRVLAYDWFLNLRENYSEDKFTSFVNAVAD